MRILLGSTAIVLILALGACSKGTDADKAPADIDAQAHSEPAPVQGMAATPAAPPVPCDAACLTEFIDKYRAALAARDPSQLPLAANVRFTENGQELPVGEALWATADGLGKYKVVFADPKAGEVGSISTVMENGQPDILALRLKIVNQQITEIESVVARPNNNGVMGSAGASLERIEEPNPLWAEEIPEAERMSREDLIKTANMYFTGLQKNDGKGVYPFTDDCNRLENGIQTTNVNSPMPWLSKHAAEHPAPSAPVIPAGASDSPMSKIPAMGCKAQFSSGVYNMVARIRDRRFLIADPVHGAVFAFAFFDHDGRPPPPVTYEGKTFQGRGLLWTWEIAEAFRIEKGQIRFIEATLNQAPYGMKPNWPETPEPSAP